MQSIFSQVLRTSLYGCVTITIILVLRLLLHRSSKRLLCLLWILVAARLLFPFQIQSPLSIQPQLSSAQLMPLEQLSGLSPSTHDSVSALEMQISENHPTVPFSQVPTVTEHKSLAPMELAAWVWLFGIVAFAGYLILTGLSLRKKLREAIIDHDGVWIAPGIRSAFVLGLVRPKIYLPTITDTAHRNFVLSHERCHIRRGDHLWKFLGYCFLTIHWFNPLVWVCYLLLCRDLEMACDETVVQNMDITTRKAYSSTLLSYSTQRSSFLIHPVAFGGASVKERIKNALNPKKPSIWIIVLLLLLLPVLLVCLFTIPKKPILTESTSSIIKSDDEILAEFYNALDNLRAQEECHIVMHYNMLSGCDYYKGMQQEFWSAGDNWYMAYLYNTAEGDLTTCFAQMDSIQYACEYSDNIPNFVNRDWSQLAEKNYAQAPILSTDWKEYPLQEIRREQGGYTIVLENTYTGSVHDTYYENLWYIHMDNSGNIISMENHTRGNLSVSYYSYNTGRFEGQFDSHTICTVTFLEPNRSVLDELLSDIPTS